MKPVPTLYPRPSALVLDMDGTLIDSVPGIAMSLGKAFTAAGRTMPEVDLRALIGPPIRIIAQQLESSLTDDDLTQIELAYRASYDSDGWAVYTLFAGVAETLSAFHDEGVPIFVVTNKPRLPTAQILERSGLRSLIAEAVSRESRQPPHSDKASMLADLLERHALEPHTSWMVGDTAEDGEAAALNGMPFLYVTYGYGDVDDPVFSVDHFSDVRKLLLPESAAHLNEKQQSTRMKNSDQLG